DPEKLRAGAIGDTPLDKDTSGQADVVNPGLAVDIHTQLACDRPLKPGSTLEQAARQAHVEQAHRDVSDEHGAGGRFVLGTVSDSPHPLVLPSARSTDGDVRGARPARLPRAL